MRDSLSGLVIVDKPAGLTSHDVVARVRRLAGTRRVGHAGTLDPMATGVLVVGVEKATRLLGHLALTEKEYLATIRLGETTDTDDAEGTIIARAPAGNIAQTSAENVSAETPEGSGGSSPRAGGSSPRASGAGETLQTAVAALTGDILQVPPGVSAIKVAGKRAYKLTREGKPPELKARSVTVRAFTINEVRPLGGVTDVDVAVTCSSGTYIRALARDLGAALGVGGHLTYLRRTRVGGYGLDRARTLDQLADAFEVTPIAEAAAAAFPRLDLTEEQARTLSHGGRLTEVAAASPAGDVGSLGHVADGTPIAAFAPDGMLVALVTEEKGQARPIAVFAQD